MYGSARQTRRADEPILIHECTDRTGSTFSVNWATKRVLQERFGDKLRLIDRIFIAHDTRDALDRLHATQAMQLLTLLTGLDEASLARLGPVEFMDPVTERRLWPPE